MIRLERTATCYHCGGAFPVGARALSAMCPECYKGVELGDRVVKRREMTHRLETCGSLTVLLRGDLAADLVRIGGTLRVHGTISGDIRTMNPVWLGPNAVVMGKLSAPRLMIEAGAQLHRVKLSINPRLTDDFGGRRTWGDVIAGARAARH